MRQYEKAAYFPEGVTFQPPDESNLVLRTVTFALKPGVEHFQWATPKDTHVQIVQYKTRGMSLGPNGEATVARGLKLSTQGGTGQGDYLYPANPTNSSGDFGPGDGITPLVTRYNEVIETFGADPMDGDWVAEIRYIEIKESDDD